MQSALISFTKFIESANKFTWIYERNFILTTLKMAA